MVKSVRSTVKEALHLGLKDAKDMVDDTVYRRVILARSISRQQAEELKRLIGAAGATVEIV